MLEVAFQGQKAIFHRKEDLGYLRSITGLSKLGAEMKRVKLSSILKMVNHWQDTDCSVLAHLA